MRSLPRTGKILLGFLLLCSLSACRLSSARQESTAGEGAGTAALSRYSTTFVGVFDTVTQITAYAESEADFLEMAEAAKAKLQSYHQYYDIYHQYEGIQNIKNINDNAGIAPVKVEKEIVDLLLFSKQMYEKTDGKVNVAMGAVLALWHDRREAAQQNPGEAALPDMAALEEASTHTDIEKLHIDTAASTVYLEDAGMRLDVGATAKGYATEQVAKFLEEQGYRHVLLSVGGNVRAVGTKFGETGEEIPWSVGIQNPDIQAGQQSIMAADIQDGSLVTSGVYERYFTVEGKNYHHIINPDTLFPGTDYLSVSIITKDSGVADALSTALFNMDLEEGKAFIEAYEGAEAMWILPDMSMVYSTGFEAFKK